jgi:receptor-type tyrosine-protein phosphatase mu
MELRCSNPQLCNIALLPENCEKNRYIDILPPDDTRFIIKESSNYFYINANCVDLGSGVTGKDTGGSRENVCMIACQAPLNNTIEDFWLMVYHSNANCILMLTPLFDRIPPGTWKEKCAKYWPDPGLTFSYSQITVTNIQEYGEKTQTLPSGKNYVVNKFAISYKWPNDITAATRDSVYSRVGIRYVYHIRYEDWPDNSANIDTDDLYYLVAIVMSFGNLSEDWTFVCHCSAGVGRTGVFAGLMRGLFTGEDALTVVKHLRRQRHGMVQTLAQFRLLRLCLDL